MSDGCYFEGMESQMDRVEEEGTAGSGPDQPSGAPRPKQLPLDWTNILLLALVHVAALGGMALYLPLHGLSLAALLLGAILTVLTIFSISAGYHRLFSHRAYEAHPVLRFILLALGAGAFQNSALA